MRALRLRRICANLGNPRVRVGKKAVRPRGQTEQGDKWSCCASRKYPLHLCALRCWFFRYTAALWLSSRTTNCSAACSLPNCRPWNKPPSSTRTRPDATSFKRAIRATASTSSSRARCKSPAWLGRTSGACFPALGPAISLAKWPCWTTSRGQRRRRPKSTPRSISSCATTCSKSWRVRRVWPSVW